MSALNVAIDHWQISLKVKQHLDITFQPIFVAHEQLIMNVC